MRRMDLDRLSRPCPDSRCDHLRGCWEGDKRRAEGGHAAAILAAPKMDTPDLVKASCSCGEYTSGGGTEGSVLIAWRMHADAKMGVKGAAPAVVPVPVPAE